jgi:hypothetical protein
VEIAPGERNTPFVKWECDGHCGAVEEPGDDKGSSLADSEHAHLDSELNAAAIRAFTDTAAGVVIDALALTG